MARPKTARGAENGVQLAPLRVTQAEAKWIQAQAAKLGITVGKFQRDRIFADMPGYKP